MTEFGSRLKGMDYGQRKEVIENAIFVLVMVLVVFLAGYLMV
jgi:hypothetical protein